MQPLWLPIYSAARWLPIRAWTRSSGRWPTRAGAQLLDSLNARNGQTLRELCSGLDMARQSVSKHLAVLEAANLVTTVRRGREKLHYLNAAPINEIGERWITRYERARVEALADLKRALEEDHRGHALVRLHDLHPAPRPSSSGRR